MRPRADGLRQSTRGRLDGLKYAPGIREPEALALSGSRNPGVRLPSPIETARLRDLKPSRRNARTHQNKQIGQIRNSMLRFGWTYPILIDENHEIIAGFGRYQAAKHLGLRDVPVIVMTGLTKAEKRALALADNKIAANAGWDRAVLAAELGELADLLPECDLDIEITGFEPAEIDSLMGDLVDPEQDPADEFPPSTEIPVSRSGDLWQLKEHQLLCGDATAAADLRRLMERHRAAMVFTDPPYNLRISSLQGRGRIKHGEFAQASGEMSSDQFARFLRTSLGLAAKHSASGCIHYVFIDWRHIGELLSAGSDVYSELKHHRLGQDQRRPRKLLQIAA